jgi:hypothetical protein
MNLKFNCGRRGTLIEMLYGVLRSRSSYFMDTYIGGVQILYSYITIDKTCYNLQIIILYTEEYTST